MPNTDTRRLKELTEKINRGETLDKWEAAQLKRLTHNGNS